MSKRIMHFIISLMLLAVASAHAQEDSADSRFFVGGDWNHTSIKGPTSTDLKGKLWGGIVGYRYLMANDVYFLLKGTWVKGTNDNATDETNETLWNAEGRLGYTFDLGVNGNSTVSPYVGISRLDNKDTIKKLANVVITDQTSTLKAWSVPVGLFFHWDVAPEFNIGLDLQGSWMFNSKGVHTIAATDFSLKGKNTFNWAVELPLIYKMTEGWDLALVPYYSKLEFKDKDGTMPHALKHTHMGARLEIGHSF